VIAVPFQTPAVTVPKLVMLPCTVLGNVVAMLGTPVPLVTNTPLLAVANADTTFAALEYNNVLIVVVPGYVAVVQLGSALAPPLVKICPALPAAVIFAALVPSPTTTPCAVNVVSPVPP